jgi:uncharacterized protein (TIGR03067 family)
LAAILENMTEQRQFYYKEAVRQMISFHKSIITLWWVILLPPLFTLCVDLNSGYSPPPTELEGVWTGSPVNDSTLGCVLEFKGSELTITVEGMELSRGTFTVDTTTDPRRIDFLIVQDADAEYEGAAVPGIYRINGDTLLIAIGERENPERPTSFSRPLETVVLEMERE